MKTLLVGFVVLAGRLCSNRTDHQYATFQPRAGTTRSGFGSSMAKLDTRELTDKTVMIDFYGLTPDKDFAREYFTAWLQARGVRVTADPKLAQLHLKVFASVLAVDQGQSLLGAPSFTVPVIGFAMPEIPLFKDVEHSGHAELKYQWPMKRAANSWGNPFQQ